MALKRNIILGITGGIAAYKACDLIRLLVKDGIRVHPVMTVSATKFVTPLMLSYLASNKVLVDIFNDNIEWNVEHVELASEADLMLIAPATANIIAKITHGIADDFVSLTALTFMGDGNKPILIAPAMNFRMWNNPVTQSNIKLLKERGVLFIDPEEGPLACGETGTGRLAPIDTIHSIAIMQLGYTQDLKGVRVVVTAGGTSEYVDPVRVITNRSSGKMGYAIAAELKSRGADVTLLSSSDLPDPGVDRLIRFSSSSDLKSKLDEIFVSCDILVMAAAVSDFTVKEQHAVKLDRTKGSVKLELVPTEDIVGSLAERKKDQFIVGFAAESADVIERARKKLQRKNLDMIIANDISRDDIGFNSDFNEVTVIDEKGEKLIERADKSHIAKEIVDMISAACFKK